jgi:hypothetical protein
MYHIWYIMVIVNFYIIWICITYDTTCLLTTSQWRPLQCIISVTPQQWRGRTIPLKNIWKYIWKGLRLQCTCASYYLCVVKFVLDFSIECCKPTLLFLWWFCIELQPQSSCCFTLCLLDTGHFTISCTNNACLHFSAVTLRVLVEVYDSPAVCFSHRLLNSSEYERSTLLYVPINITIIHK